MNGRKGLLATLLLLCTLIGATLGYLIATRFTAVETRIGTSEVDIGVLKIKVEILEGGNVKLNVPLDKDRLQRMVMDEIRRQTAEPEHP
jgi:hypothetical protein